MPKNANYVERKVLIKQNFVKNVEVLYKIWK